MIRSSINNTNNDVFLLRHINLNKQCIDQSYMNYPTVYQLAPPPPPPIQQNSTSSNELPSFVPSTTNGNLYKTPTILRCEEQRIPVRITRSHRPTICQPFRSTKHLTSANLIKVPITETPKVAPVLVERSLS